MNALSTCLSTRDVIAMCSLHTSPNVLIHHGLLCAGVFVSMQ